MTNSKSVNISAVLDQLIYQMGNKKYSDGESVSKMVDDLKDLSIKSKLQTIIKNNPEIGELTLVDYSWTLGEYGISENPGGLYAATFVSDEGDVYVSFRGTDDGNWKHNAAAYGSEPSQMQQWSLEFFNQSIEALSEKMSIRNLYVTGHSQGGNNAQYVTLFSNYTNDIDACYSFDGPGFSEEVVSDAKSLWGEAHFHMQVSKMYAFNGEKDYVHQQGEVQLIPEERTTIISTPDTESFDFEGWHLMYYMLGEDGLNPEGRKSQMSIFIGQLVSEVNQLPDEEREFVSKVAMDIMELKKSGKKADDLTSQSFEKFKSILVKVLDSSIVKNRGMLSSVLREMGIDRKASEAFEDMARRINTYPEVVRRRMYTGMLYVLKFEDNDIVLDKSKFPVVLLTTSPVIVKTLISDPGDVIRILGKLGADDAVNRFAGEHPWIFAGIVLGTVLFAPFVLKAASILRTVAVVIDVSILIIQTLDYLAGPVKEAIIAFFETLQDWAESLAEWFHSQSAGVKYVQSNPRFKVDTVKLRDYAQRIESVISRLESLDSEMNSLYLEAGLLDLWDILKANLVVGNTGRLRRAKQYLYQCAERFEIADSKAFEYIGEMK